MFKWEWIPRSPRETAKMTKMNTWREQHSSDTPGVSHLLRIADNPQLHSNPETTEALHLAKAMQEEPRTTQYTLAGDSN